MKVHNERPWIFVIGGAERGGAEGQLVRLASLLHAAGRPVECVFLFGGGPLLTDLDRVGVRRHVLRDAPRKGRLHTLFSLAWAVVRLGILLRRRRPVLVMAWLTFATWPTLTLAECLTSASRVAGIRGEVLAREVRWAAFLFRRSLRRADAVVVNSPTLIREAIGWGANEDKVTVIPNGVDAPKRLADPASSRVAVMVSNYRPYKGHADLLTALALCSSDAHVRLCGSGAQNEVERLASDLNVTHRLHFVRQPADVPSELERAGFAVHPSHTEGLSNAILEEMSAGLPVIAMAVGGNSMLVDHAVNGYLLDVGDHAGLARAIDDLTQNAQLRSQLGAASRAKSAEFAWEVCAGRYEDLLLRLTKCAVEAGAPAS